MSTLAKMRFAASLTVVMLVAMIAAPSMAMAAQATVDLGTTASFAVLGGSIVTNTGSSVVSGDLGIYPGSGVTPHFTGFPPGVVGPPGTVHDADAVATQAQTDLVTAYNDAAGRQVTRVLTGTDLGGLTLTPGVYFFSSSAQLTGDLILDAQGDPDAVFIFQIGSTLTTASGSHVHLINGARFCRVFWQVGSSATLGTTTQFVGHIFALTSITANTNATVEGQLLARNGAVTLDTNTITNDICVTQRPLRVAKTASPSTLPIGGGWVDFTYAVSNLGTAPVSAVNLTDNKIATLTRVSGDTNEDNVLQPSETWIYTGRAHLTATTTNVAVAAGTVHQVPASGSSTVTVAVAGRLLPNTATPWYTVLLAGIALTLLGAAGYWMTTRKTNA
jgi:hypothetical protein